MPRWGGFSHLDLLELNNEILREEGNYMTTLVLKNRFRANATLLTNEFIDKHMPKANGEFVKVYLFLLRHIDSPDSYLEIPTIADCLNNTETDIIRAIKYWESEGLLSLEIDDDENVVGLELFKINHIHPTTSIDTYKSDKITNQQPKKASKPLITEKRTSKESPLFSSKTCDLEYSVSKPSKGQDNEFKTILHIAELYLGKTLSNTEVDIIIYLYEDLGMNSELIEFLIGHCVDNGHRSIHYIKTVAFDWVDRGIKTSEEAKRETQNYNNTYRKVMDTFGIQNRGLAAQEKKYVNTWTHKHGFPPEIIEEACNRTIKNLGHPNFKYADKILSEWRTNNITDIQGIHNLDQQYRLANELRKAPSNNIRKAKSSSKSEMNYEKRAYDYDSLVEEQQFKNLNAKLAK